MDFNGLLDRLGLEGFYVSKPENVRYLSGFVEGKDGKVVLTRSGPVFITDGRYLVEAKEQRFPHRILLKRNELPALLSEYLTGRVGFEAEALSVAELETLRKGLPKVEFVATHEVFDRIRRVKTPQEIEAIRRSAALADEGFQHILPFIQPGVREIEVALELEFFLRRRGSEGAAFSITVASGERGAMPHGGASEKKIQAGELVTLDFGAVTQGYRSDMTRTVGVGRVREELRRMYAAVQQAEETALEAVGPGQSGKELDRMARELLIAQGYGEFFTHSLGHGVGLFIHEGPSLSQTSEDVLEAGNVVTIEPGVYIPGLGGVRIEDLVWVTESGHQVLSKSPKELLEL
ncbi:M24 family metallopeptidase [Meiothermus granaticius]|uniref:Aminopeptidase YpdF n=1 Tax=Meiothermus granaticius NBRC 107808 TaxID=1227551 RepID=A0A399F3E9_9DEIN|nr:Xaa-Pro peptidase family protein [Meiothermus granaticius]MCL6527507.1 Xaa-Pro peptidase family protein [Thermaceae bacterium]RIH91214.1 Aminopeptidase YpdF [Meiothermus granaticius NBRC 107808]GEM85811.1 aminopeptidase [Meiothermus granaticius NBRC 107808]